MCAINVGFFIVRKHIYLEDVETEVENDVDTEVLTLSPSLTRILLPNKHRDGTDTGRNPRSKAGKAKN